MGREEQRSEPALRKSLDLHVKHSDLSVGKASERVLDSNGIANNEKHSSRSKSGTLPIDKVKGEIDQISVSGFLLLHFLIFLNMYRISFYKVTGIFISNFQQGMVLIHYWAIPRA